MEKLINGKLYDTDAAQHITSTYPNGTKNQSNFRFMKESLYVTESGTYFIAGEGGPKTRYKEPAPQGGMTGGEDIREITEEEAFRWCQKNDEVETAKEHFEDFIEPA